MYIITPPPLTCASKYKIHFNCVILELVQKVLRSSFAKLVILLKEIAYAVFDLPGALFFPYNSYFVWWIALRGC